METIEKVVNKLTKTGMTRQSSEKLVMKLLQEYSRSYLMYLADAYNNSIKEFDRTQKN